jgi:hypothetical protein
VTGKGDRRVTEELQKSYRRVTEELQKSYRRVTEELQERVTDGRKKALLNAKRRT